MIHGFGTEHASDIIERARRTLQNAEPARDAAELDPKFLIERGFGTSSGEPIHFDPFQSTPQ